MLKRLMPPYMPTRSLLARPLTLVVRAAAGGSGRRPAVSSAMRVCLRGYIHPLGIRLGDVSRLVAEEPSEWSAENKSRPLCPGGRKWQPHQVELLLHDHREPKRVGQALLVGLAV